MAAEDQAQKDQARGDAAVQRLSKTRRPVIQIVASGVIGTVMAATAAGLIIDQLPKTGRAARAIERLASNRKLSQNEGIETANNVIRMASNGKPFEDALRGK
jgi:hypothetical protein